MSYTRESSGALESRATEVEVESFRWVVEGGPIPTEAEVYAELGAYFSGTGTLGRVQSVIGQSAVTETDARTYYEKLSEEVVSGDLDRRFDTDEPSVVGTDGTSGWHQVGTPSVRPGPDDTCGGTTVPGGEGGFETRVSSRYYWNCTQDGQWVPVKVPEPGVDYARDDQLVTDPVEASEEERRMQEGRPVSDYERDCRAHEVMKWDPVRDTCIYRPENQYTGSSGG